MGVSGGGPGAALRLLPLTGCCDWEHKSLLFVTRVVSADHPPAGAPWLPGSDVPFSQAFTRFHMSASRLRHQTHNLCGWTARRTERRGEEEAHHANANVRATTANMLASELARLERLGGEREGGDFLWTLFPPAAPEWPLISTLGGGGGEGGESHQTIFSHDHFFIFS